MPGYGIEPADPIGTLQSMDQDLARTALLRTQNQVGQQQIQQQAFNLQQQQRQAQLDAQFARAASQIPQSLPQWERATKLADLALESGRFKDAEVFLQRGNQALAYESLASKRAGEEEDRRAQARARDFSTSAAIYSGVNSQGTLDLANEMWEREHPGQTAPLRNHRYDPKVVQMFQDSLIKRRDAAAQAKDWASAERARALDRKTEMLQDLQASLLRAQIDEVKSKTDKREKDGGKPANPSKNDLDEVKKYVKQAYPNITAAQLLNDPIINEIAGEAKEAQLRNGGEFSKYAADAFRRNAGRIKLKEGGFFGGGGVEIAPRGAGTGTRESPVEASSIQEVQKLPAGAYFKADGKLYRYKGNGKAELVEGGR